MHAWQTTCIGFAPFFTLLGITVTRCTLHITGTRICRDPFRRPDLSLVPTLRGCSISVPFISHLVKASYQWLWRGAFHQSVSLISPASVVSTLLCGFPCPSLPRLLGKHRQKLLIYPCLISVEKTRLNPDLSEQSVSCRPACWWIPSDLIFYAGCVCSISACTLAGIFLWRWIDVVYWSLRVNWGCEDRRRIKCKLLIKHHHTST